MQKNQLKLLILLGFQRAVPYLYTMVETLQNLSQKELLELLEKQLKKAEELQQQSTGLQQHNEKLLEENLKLKALVEKLQKLAYGKKRERFQQSDQPQLPFSMPAEELKWLQEETVEKITYERKKGSPAKHPGRTPLPDNLPVQEVHIHPEGDLTNMICIGQEVTEELEIKPVSVYIRRTIRHKYKAKDADTFLIAPLPERLFPRCMAGTSLIASILVDKYAYHMPYYRQAQRFKWGDIPIPATTIEGWGRQGLEVLNILYEFLLKRTRAKGYLQADESPIKVQDGIKEGSCHQGYYWVYYCPLDSTVLFNYQPGRGAIAAANVLDGFQGFLQTDGYGVYDKIGKREGVTHVGCWAHARREFHNALTNDKDTASIALGFIQALYKIEEDAKERNLTPAERKELRLSKALPQMNAFGKWLKDEYYSGKVLPKSAMGKAIVYTVERWEKLNAYLNDGSIEIDNNLVENAIRPLALGRKNYLFAGSHEAAARAACIYSFFAMCKKEEVDPLQWMIYVFDNLRDTKMTELEHLFPAAYKKHLSESSTD